MIGRTRSLLVGSLLLLGPLLGACGTWTKWDGGDAPSALRASPAATGECTPPDTSGLSAAATFDHAPLTSVLMAHVKAGPSGTALDYAAFLGDSAAIGALDTYRFAMTSVNPSALATPEEKLVFWMNAYNANVISGVLNASGGDIGFSTSENDFLFFAERAHLIGGYLLSLDEIEHGVIRGDFEHRNVVGSCWVDEMRAWHAELWTTREVDPRIHMALNCAAKSCPDLQPSAWAVASLEADLQAALVEFLANPIKGAGPTGVSSLFSWFGVDFLREATSVTEYISRNRTGGLGDVAVGGCGADADGTGCLPYDWKLNAVGN